MHETDENIERMRLDAERKRAALVLRLNDMDDRDRAHVAYGLALARDTMEGMADEIEGETGEIIIHQTRRAIHASMGCFNDGVEVYLAGVDLEAVFPEGAPFQRKVVPGGLA